MSGKQEEIKTNIRNESGDFIPDFTDIKIMREYNEQLYAYKLDNFGEMD